MRLDDLLSHLRASLGHFRTVLTHFDNDSPVLVGFIASAISVSPATIIGSASGVQPNL